MSAAPDAGRLGRLLDWIEERTGWSFLVDLGKHKQVPLHRHTLWYYLGGMTLFLFSLQVATGILLLLYYRASSEEAFESVQFIMAKVPFGWLIRSIHSWSANLLIFVLFLHMFSVFFMKAYRKPRELTWIGGTLLLFLMLGFGFSGYLLPWNKLAFFATQVGTDIAGALPYVGHFALRFLRGGEHVTGGTLTRFYGIHVAVLPALTTALLGLHLLMVQKHGMSVPPSVAQEGGHGMSVPPSVAQEGGKEKGKSMSFWPHFLLRDAVGWCAALGILAALAALFPWELGEKADPFAPAPAGIRPEWYFAWMFQTLKYLPAHILGIEGELLGILGFSLAAVVWLLVPFLDSSSAPGNPVSRLFTLAGWIALAYMAAMTLIVYLPQGH